MGNHLLQLRGWQVVASRLSCYPPSKLCHSFLWNTECTLSILKTVKADKKCNPPSSNLILFKHRMHSSQISGPLFRGHEPLRENYHNLGQQALRFMKSKLCPFTPSLQKQWEQLRKKCVNYHGYNILRALNHRNT